MSKNNNHSHRRSLEHSTAPPRNLCFTHHFSSPCTASGRRLCLCVRTI